MQTPMCTRMVFSLCKLLMVAVATVHGGYGMSFSSRWALSGHARTCGTFRERVRQMVSCRWNVDPTLETQSHNATQILSAVWQS